MKLGITGLPGAGKTTVFEALTRQCGGSGNMTEDRIGTVAVPDDRIDILSRMYNPKKTIYAQVEYFLPGLAGQGDRSAEKGAHTAVRDCDALIHVVRNFSAYGLEPPDPLAAFRALDQELMLADLMTVEKRLERLTLDARRGRKIDEEEQALLLRCKAHLDEEAPIRRFPELAEARPLRGFALLSARPMLVLLNNEDETDEAPDIPGLTDAEACLAIKAKLEHELGQMSAEEAAEFLAEFNLSASAPDRVIRASYDLMGLIAFFTVGEDEVRAWTIRRNTEAVEAAGAVHSDIKKGFIRAEVVAYDDLMAAGTYAEARKRGTVRLEGKTYPVKDGDIINFRFNV